MYLNIYVLYGCSYVVSVLSHAFHNDVLGRHNDLDKEQTLICNSHCPFGFLPDVEGKLTCKCFDPCRNILCLQGTVCVAKMPENCKWEPCRAEAKCQEEASVAHTTMNKDDYWLEFPVALQDEPDKWRTKDTERDTDRCSQSLPMAAVDCKHKRRRWYFNPMTGKCERFQGCVTSGNNFGRKLYCKEQCRYPFIKQREANKASRLQELQDKDCSMPLVENAHNCVDKTKRWHYNPKTKTCEKFLGCKSNGNNFSRKSLCKSACLARSRELLILKDKRVSESSAR